MPAIEKRVFPQMDRKLSRRSSRRSPPTRRSSSLVDEMAERHEHALALQRLDDDGPHAHDASATCSCARGVVAARLAALGVKTGDRVVLSAQNHPDWPIAYFGIAPRGRDGGAGRSGARRGARSRTSLAESGARVVALGRDGRRSATRSPRRHGVPRAPRRARGHRGGRRARAARAWTSRRDDVASLIYTSGTTGEPKGVMLTHANFTSLVAALAPIFPLTRGRPRALSVLPLHHTFEFTCGLLLPLSRGARIVYLDELTGERLADGLKAGARRPRWSACPRSGSCSSGASSRRSTRAGPLARDGVRLRARGEPLARGKRSASTLGRVLFGPVHAALGGTREVPHLRRRGAAAGHAEALRRARPPAHGGLRPHRGGAGAHGRAGRGKRLEPGRSASPSPASRSRSTSPDDRGVGEVARARART